MNGLLYYNMSLGSTNAALEVKNIEEKKKKSQGIDKELTVLQGERCVSRLL